jgi:hypothetical protein
MPAGIGPHEGRELALMLSGRKPAAMFSDVLPLDRRAPLGLFRPHVQSGRFAMRIDVFALHPNLRLRFVYYTRRGQSWRIERLRELNRRLIGGEARWSDDDDVETGRLLGYSERDIAAFLAHKRRLTPGR